MVPHRGKVLQGLHDLVMLIEHMRSILALVHPRLLSDPWMGERIFGGEPVPVPVAEQQPSPGEWGGGGGGVVGFASVVGQRARGRQPSKLLSLGARIGPDGFLIHPPSRNTMRQRRRTVQTASFSAEPPRNPWRLLRRGRTRVMAMAPWDGKTMQSHSWTYG